MKQVNDHYSKKTAHPSYFKTGARVFRYDPDFPIRVSFERQNTTVSHQHEFCECIYVVNGMGMHQSETHVPIPIHRGDIIVIPRGGHHAYTQVDGLEIINLMFDTSLLPPTLMELYSDPAYKHVFLRDYHLDDTENFPMTHLDEPVFRKQETLLHYLLQEGNNAGKHAYKLGLFMAILSHLCEVWQVHPDAINVPLDIPKLTAYLSQHFQQEIYLEDLAKRAGMSCSTLGRHFHAALGMSPIIYLRNLRLRHAAELLLKTELPLKEIVYQSGFSRMSYFFKAFKDCYGATPLEYRGKSITLTRNNQPAEKL